MTDLTCAAMFRRVVVPFTASRQVEFAHTDMAGMAHFAQYFTYMESAEHELFRSLGLSIHSPEGDHHVSWPRVACSFDFLKPLRFEDCFKIHLTIERLGTSSVSWVAKVCRDGDLCATGRCTTVFCELHGDAGPVRRPIPPEIREKLERFADLEGA